MNSPPVNLIARLPTLMQKYDEIIKITDSQNPEFDLIWEIEQWMRRNLYIITAEEYGLRRYERLLGIIPMDGESWQARRNHILVRWNQETPYTFRFLVGLLEMLTDGNFEVIPNFDKYEMEIRVFTSDLGIKSDLQYIWRHIIPANIRQLIGIVVTFPEEKETILRIKGVAFPSYSIIKLPPYSTTALLRIKGIAFPVITIAKLPPYQAAT